VEGLTENSVGGGVEGDWEVEEPVADPRPLGGAVRRYWTSRYYRCGKASAGEREEKRG